MDKEFRFTYSLEIEGSNAKSFEDYSETVIAKISRTILKNIYQDENH